MTEITAPPAGGVVVAQPGRSAELTSWRRLLRRPTFLVGAAILLFWVVCAVFGSAIAPHDPLAQQLLATNQPPSAAHWFGTDQLGRDVFSRVIVGVRYILVVSFLATVLGTVLGTTAGALVVPTAAASLDMAIEFVIEAFAVVVIGGLGSMRGALVGALIVGLIRAYSIVLYPELEVLAIYAIVIAVLLLRPAGLFGRPVA